MKLALENPWLADASAIKHGEFHFLVSFQEATPVDVFPMCRPGRRGCGANELRKGSDLRECPGGKRPPESRRLEEKVATLNITQWLLDVVRYWWWLLTATNTTPMVVDHYWARHQTSLISQQE